MSKNYKIETPVFPKTRYQGSKYKLKEWIKHILQELEFDTAIDAFSGTSSISYIMKEMGKTIYSNDILKFNYRVSNALIENSKEIISDLEFKNILTKKEQYNYSYFIRDTFSGIYYLDEENEYYKRI